MPTVSRPNVYVNGGTTTASEANDNETTLYNLVNGTLDKDNLSPTANIAGTQLETKIDDAGKISGKALTELADIPAAAGVIPSANVPTYTPTAANALAGSVVQVVNTQTGAVSSNNTAFPNDDTIPQNTEGSEVMTLAITPTSATNKLKIDVVVNCAQASGYATALALFQDTTVGALAASWSTGSSGSANYPNQIILTHYMTAGTVSATTFKARLGVYYSSTDTTTFNGANAGRIFGGVMASSITITEIKV